MLPCLTHSMAQSNASTAPSESGTSAWLQRSRMAYTDVPTRVTAMTVPSTSTGTAWPSGSSSNRATTCSTIVGNLQLGADHATHVGAQRLGEPPDDFVEEPEHDEAVGDLGRHATALQVEPLVRVDRAGRGRMRTTHVVLFDVEVGHRVRGETAVGQDEVAVGLERVRACRPATHPDEAAVGRAGLVGDRALEQQVTERFRRDVVLQRAEVVHLRAAAAV